MRWLEFGIFTPLMRNHAAIGTRDQEIYRFDGQLDHFRNIIRIRYGLLPYLYSEFMKAVLQDEMYFRPLSFDYPEDSHAYAVEDQLMVGESIMIAPVYTQNACGRYVYLPEDMLMVKMKSLEERTCQEMKKGHHYIEIPLNEVVFFIKPGHMVPLAVLPEEVKTTADTQNASLEWLSYQAEGTSYQLYSDDGYSKNYDSESNWTTVNCR